MIKKNLLFYLALIALTLALGQIDRYFFKLNDGFCVRNILGIIHPDQERETSYPPITDLDSVFNQEYHYLAKGHQSYAFVSQDQNYVLKFYRFPSHLRLFPWLNHPLSSKLSSRRQQIMEYNLEKLDMTFNSYKIAFEELPKETGTLWIHLTPKGNWNQTVTLIDKTGNRYTLPIDPLCFVIQKKAELIFPSLEHIVATRTLEKGKRMIDSMIELLMTQCHKGIKNADPILEKNFGWDGTRALSIDIGRFVSTIRQDNHFVYIQEILDITHPMATWLENNEPQLFNYYKEKVESIKQTKTL